MDDFPWSVDTTAVVTVGATGATGTIEVSGDEDLFKVTLTAGQTYVFELVSTGLADPCLYLYAPDVTLLDSDDDGAGGNNSRITYTATESGTYYLGASDFRAGSGSYRLTAQSSNDDYPWSTTTAGVVQVDQSPVAGVVGYSGDLDLLSIELEEGLTYTLSLRSTGLTDPYLIVYDDFLEQLVAANDVGTSRDAQVVITATYSGTHYVGAADFGTGTGGYMLSAVTTVDDYAWSQSSAQQLSPGGGGVSGLIDYTTDGDLFKLSAESGQAYVIELDASGGLDGFIGVFDSNMHLVASADGGGSGGDAFAGFVASTSGNYYIGVSGALGGTGSYSVSTRTATGSAGTSAANSLSGTSGVDVIQGMSGNDVLQGGGGNDYLDGGSGLDTAVYTGLRASYIVGKESSTTVVSHVSSAGSEGTDSLVAVERLQFSDMNVAFDLSGNAGLVAKVLGAVFGREYVQQPRYVGIGIDLLDAGMGYEAAVDLAIREVLGHGASSAAVVNLLYMNVMGTAPDGQTLAAYAHQLDSGAYSPGALGLVAAESVPNLWNIGLSGLSATGLAYL